jgi:hypothetical protein
MSFVVDLDIVIPTASLPLPLSRFRIWRSIRSVSLIAPPLAAIMMLLAIQGLLASETTEMQLMVMQIIVISPTVTICASKVATQSLVQSVLSARRKIDFQLSPDSHQDVSKVKICQQSESLRIREIFS